MKTYYLLFGILLSLSQQHHQTDVNSIPKLFAPASWLEEEPTVIEITKEVPVEIVREVPVETVKEVIQIKEVLPDFKIDWNKDFLDSFPKDDLTLGTPKFRAVMHGNVGCGYCKPNFDEVLRDLKNAKAPLPVDLTFEYKEVPWPKEEKGDPGSGNLPQWHIYNGNDHIKRFIGTKSFKDLNEWVYLYEHSGFMTPKGEATSINAGTVSFPTKDNINLALSFISTGPITLPTLKKKISVNGVDITLPANFRADHTSTPGSSIHVFKFPASVYGSYNILGIPAGLSISGVIWDGDKGTATFQTPFSLTNPVVTFESK